MSIEQMRSAIKKVYSGKKWKDKVDKMQDYQVAAIYERFLHSGKLQGVT